MALSGSESWCTNCLRLAKEDMARGIYNSKYMIQGTYRKVSETNNQFSYGKAAIGTLVFGPVGAVAGINGKKMVTYRCDKSSYSPPVSSILYKSADRTLNLICPNYRCFWTKRTPPFPSSGNSGGVAGGHRSHRLRSSVP